MVKTQLGDKMKKINIFCIVLALFVISGLSAQQYDQPWIQDSVGYTSTYSPDYPIDLEMADNFSGLTDPINSLTFYGMQAAFDINGWITGPPAAIEPFFVKFYNIQTEWTQAPQAEPGIIAPVTGTYALNLYDSYGDGWNGGKLDVYVNGILVLDEISCVATGPDAFTFSANAGDEIIAVYTAGSYAYENWYEILDPEDSVIAQDGDDTQTAEPTGIGSFPITPLLAPLTGTYTVNLYDSFGNGWTGGMLDVYVDGSLVLGSIAGAGSGPNPFTFSANAGDEIATVFTAGSFAFENWYEILDPEDSVIAQDGDDTQTVEPTGIGFVSTMITLEPSWATPVASFAVDASTSYVTDWTWGGWQLYKYEVTLPSSVNLASGWVSAQVDAANGSGLWFLWAQGSGGDLLSHQKFTDFGKGASSPEAAFAQQNNQGENPVRVQNGVDMAFELYTSSATLIVVDVAGNVSGSATIVPGGTIPEGLQGPDTGAPAVLYTISATGTQDVQVFKPSQYTGDWYCWLSVGSSIYAGNNPIPAATASIIFSGIDFDAKGEVVLMIDDDNNATLPVTLSSFTAVLTADLFVKIAWISESETDHAGYNILRSEANALSTALTVNNGMIDQGVAHGTQMNYLFTDTEIDTDATYYYWLESVSLNGESEYYGALMVTVRAEDEEPSIPVIPVETKLLSAFPNPFNPSTNLRYSMKEAGDLRIEVYNLKGQILRSFTNNHSQAGYYQMSWDGRDANGSLVGTGVYFYRMISGKYSATKKMVLAK